MRCLRARRHQHAGMLRLDARARRAIAERKHIGIACRLQRGRHDELVVAVDLEPVEILEPRRRLDARRPHDEIGME